jgi:hypothetical protein
VVSRGGKAQIIAEAAALNGQDVGARLAALPADSPVAVVQAFLAADLAAMLIALLQGAHVTCRAAGTIQPFDQAARASTALAQSRYPGPGSALPGSD